jgi:hypothetical protein
MRASSERRGKGDATRFQKRPASLQFDGYVRAAKSLAQRVARLLDFQQLDRRLATVGQPHLHRCAAIEIDDRKEGGLLLFVGTNQNRGDKEREVHGVGSPVWRRCIGIRVRSGYAGGSVADAET